MGTNNNVCFNCDSAPKYKCPVCRLPYCSVPCYQVHKAVNCQTVAPVHSEEETNLQEKPRNFVPTEDALPLETLKNLKDSSGVRECLQNPHVRQILRAVDRSENPTNLIAQAMMEPIFVEFATECLKVVQPPS